MKSLLQLQLNINDWQPLRSIRGGWPAARKGSRSQNQILSVVVRLPWRKEVSALTFLQRKSTLSYISPNFESTPIKETLEEDR